MRNSASRFNTQSGGAGLTVDVAFLTQLVVCSDRHKIMTPTKKTFKRKCGQCKKSIEVETAKYALCDECKRRMR